MSEHDNNSHPHKSRPEKTSKNGSKACSLGIATGIASNRINKGIHAFTDDRKNSLQEKIKKQSEERTKRYYLQRISKKMTFYEDRLNACMSSRNDTVSVHYDDSKQHAHYRGLMRCDDVWRCPVCSARITSARADELRKALAYAQEVNGWRIAMVTLTARHNRFDTLEGERKMLKEAKRRLHSGRAWEQFSTLWGYQGGITGSEPLWNEANGWHYHLHVIILLSGDLVDDFEGYDEMLEERLHSELAPRWVEIVKKLGGSASLEHGLDVTVSDKEIGAYVSKFGHLPEGVTWDASLEMTKSAQKTVGEGLHPFQILELCETEHDETKRKRYQALWFEYCEAMKNTNQLSWSQGLKAKLCIEEVNDSQLEEGELEENIQSFVVPHDVWSDIVFIDWRAQLLNLVCESRCDWQQIESFLHDARRRALVLREERAQKRRLKGK